MGTHVKYGSVLDGPGQCVFSALAELSLSSIQLYRMCLLELFLSILNNAKWPNGSPWSRIRCLVFASLCYAAKTFNKFLLE